MKKLVSFILFISLSSCASFGVATPKTFNEKLAAGYVTIQGLNTMTLDLLTAKKIAPDDAENINQQTDNAKAALDIARTMSKTDLSSADTKLDATITGLTALQNYLRSQGGEK